MSATGLGFRNCQSSSRAHKVPRTAGVEAWSTYPLQDHDGAKYALGLVGAADGGPDALSSGNRIT